MIAAARSHDDVARLMGRPELGVGGPLSITPWPDAANPDRYALNIVQSGLSLPDRDYYLDDTPRSAEIRAKFRSYVAAMLALGPLSGHGIGRRRRGRAGDGDRAAQWTREGAPIAT